jgi:soluble lytic murein transglycosylase-like protein
LEVALGSPDPIECLLVLDGPRLRKVVRWGLPLAASLTFAVLPADALASRDRSADRTADLIALNSSGRRSAEDPRIALTPPPAGVSLLPRKADARSILIQAAANQGVDPNLLLALSYWESGWRQDAVSSEGAVGLLQVMPLTAQTAGPNLLGRQVDISNPLDNVEVGAALLKDLLRKYDTRTALAAYYQGEPALLSGSYAPDTWQYADGVLALGARIASGNGP